MKVKKSKRNLNKSNKRKKSNKYLFLSIISICLLIVYLVYFFTGFNFIFEIFDEPKKFEVVDECGVIMGRLIHQVRDKDDCELQCKNFCDIKDMSFDSFDFTESEESCHKCDCYCD